MANPLQIVKAKVKKHAPFKKQLLLQHGNI